MVDEGRGAALGTTGASELFQLLRDGHPRTRAELSTMTGLARSTIASRVDSLMDLGLINPVEDAASTGGRPSSRFALNPVARLVLAADIGASHAIIGITDLSGTMLTERQSPIRVEDGPVSVLSWMIESAHDLLAELGRPQADLIAIGIGLPGPVEHSTGRPFNPPIMPGWDRFDVPAFVRQHFDVPVLVDNDVNIMALGERGFAWPNAEDMIFVKVATGIGSGVIAGGTLQRGAQGTAGDIGHVQVARGAGIACRCGNIGCLEALASGPAIAAALGLESSASVLDLVKSGNTDAIQAVRQAGRDIGEVLTTCVSLINPSVIVLGGYMVQAGEHLLAGVREVVYTRSMPLASEHLSIVQSAAGPRAAVTGASMLAIHHALSARNIDALTG